MGFFLASYRDGQADQELSENGEREARSQPPIRKSCLQRQCLYSPFPVFFLSFSFPVPLLFIFISYCTYSFSCILAVVAGMAGYGVSRFSTDDVKR